VLPTVSLGPLQLMLPDLGSLRWLPTGIAVLAGIALLRWHWPLLAVLGLSGLLSAAAAVL